MEGGGGIIASLVPTLILGLIFVVPMWRILSRTGHPAWLALLVFLPLIGIFALCILLWVVAFRKWPGDEIAETF